jgi:putative intracellular protease/amidase
MLLCKLLLCNSSAFEKSVKLHSILKSFESKDKWVTAICASPIALKAAKIGLKKRLTSYPSFQKDLQDAYQYLQDRVVIDGKLITSRGPGTSFDFAYALVGVLVNDDMVQTIKSGMCFQ